MPGAKVAIALTAQAMSTPSVMSENIVGRPWRKPARPPERIGQPPQKTIGVARSSCSQLPVWPASQLGSTPPWSPFRGSCRPCPSMPSIATAMRIAASPLQIRSRRRSRLWLLAAPASCPIGSSGIPQMLQVPGELLVTCGCIGHRQPNSPAAVLAQQGLTTAGSSEGWMTSSCMAVSWTGVRWLWQGYRAGGLRRRNRWQPQRPRGPRAGRRLGLPPRARRRC